MKYCVTLRVGIYSSATPVPCLGLCVERTLLTPRPTQKEAPGAGWDSGQHSGGVWKLFCVLQLFHAVCQGEQTLRLAFPREGFLPGSVLSRGACFVAS